MKHVFTSTLLIPNAHVIAHEPTKCIPLGAYFLRLTHCIQPSENTLPYSCTTTNPPTQHYLCDVASTGWPLTTLEWQRKKGKNNYKPKPSVTDNLAFKESSTYPSFAVSDCHLPWLLKNLSWTPLLAAVMAQPEWRLCSPYCCDGNPNSSNLALKYSRSLELVKQPLSLSFLLELTW